MSHSYVQNKLHVVFSTKERRKLIRDEVQRELWAYISESAEIIDYQYRPSEVSRTTFTS